MINLKAKIYENIDPILSGYEVIWANQNGKKPDNKMATMQIVALVNGGSDTRWNALGNNGELDIHSFCNITLRVQLFGAGAFVDAIDLSRSIDKPSVCEAMTVDNLSVYDVSSVTDLTGVIDSSYEERAQVDLFMRFGAKVSDIVQIIETVNVVGNYEVGGVVNPDLEQTIIIT